MTIPPALALMAGCATKEPPAPTVVTRTVEVPVRLPCLKLEQIPKEPRYALDQPDVLSLTFEQLATAALIELEQRREWQREATALLMGCTE